MNGQINVNGCLCIERNGKIKMQGCHDDDDEAYCGDWCPGFQETQITATKDGAGQVVSPECKQVRLCCFYYAPIIEITKDERVR